MILSPTQIGVLWVLVAIVCDVVSTLFSAKANGLEDKIAQGVAGILYIGSFIAAAIALKYMQAGILYVLWSGIGIIATAVLARFFLGQEIDVHGWIGMLIVAIGITYIAQFSNIDV